MTIQPHVGLRLRHGILQTIGVEAQLQNVQNVLRKLFDVLCLFQIF